jgi:hypothetical protein
MVAGALKYPQIRLLGIIGACRLVRFSVEALLAQRFGRPILRIAQTPLVEGIVIAVLVISISGTAYSLYDWTKRSKHARA